MIRRFVLLRLAPEHLAERDDLGRRVLVLLRSLPMVAEAHVAAHIPALQPEHPGWDLVVTVDFASPEHARAYGQDPVHAAFVRDELAPRVAARASFSMEALSAAVKS